MRYLIPILLLLSLGAHAQSICVSADCKDTVRYPQDTVTLNGVVSSTAPDAVKTVSWRSSVGVAKIDSPAAVVTIARGLSKGGTLFVFALTGTSVKGATATAPDSVVYIPNKAPTAICGAGYTDTVSTGVLSGSGVDPEGLPVTYAWVQVSGPNTATITAPVMQNPLITGLVSGAYLFRLTVTDSGGLQGTATQSVIVLISKTVVKVTTTVVTLYSDGTTTTTTTVVTTVP